MPRLTVHPARRGRLLAARLAGVAAAVAFVVLTPLPAQAHAALVSSSPSDGDVVTSVPTEVSFTFDESVVSPAFVSVIGPDGSNIADGNAVVDGATVRQAVRLFPQQGRYSASYRVVSDDGHPVTGTIRFTVDPVHGTDAPTSPAVAACAADGCGDSGTPLWQRESTWIVVALAGLAAAIVLIFALGLRSGSSSSDAGGGG